MTRDRIAHSYVVSAPVYARETKAHEERFWCAEWRTQCGEHNVIRRHQARSRYDLIAGLRLIDEEALDGEVKIVPPVGPFSIHDLSLLSMNDPCVSVRRPTQSFWLKADRWKEKRGLFLARLQSLVHDAWEENIIDSDDRQLLFSMALAIVPTAWSDRPIY